MKKILFIAVPLGLLLWTYTIENSIVISMENYTISTNIMKLLLLFFIVFLPLLLVRSLIIKIIHKIKKETYASQLLGFIDTFGKQQDHTLLVNLIKSLSNSRFIKKMKKIQQLIEIRDYDEALILLDKIKYNKRNEFIIIRLRCLIYKLQEDIPSLTIFCKKALELKNIDRIWFLRELFEISFNKGNLDKEIVFLHDKLQLIKRTENSLEYKHCYCMIEYYYVTKLRYTAPDKVREIANKVIKVYPTFVPMYGLLVELYMNNKKDKKFISILKTLWINNKNYEAIKIWNKYYKEVDLVEVKEFVTKAQVDNSLLLAALYTQHGMYLEAHDILQNIPDNEIDKYYVWMDLMKKEKNYKNIDDILTKLHLTSQGRDSFWSNHIK